MTSHTTHRIPGARERNSLDIARDAFTALVTGPAPLSVDGGSFPGLPNRAVPLDEVRDHLAVPGRQALRDAVWAHLVRQAHTGTPAWLVGCVGVALPHLTRIAARLTGRFPGDPTDIQDGVLSGFLTGLAAVRPEHAKIPTRLWWAAHRGGQTALREARRAPIPTDPQFLSRPPIRPWGHEDLVLARAVAEKVLTRIEADLISATRLDHTPLTAWADQHGISRWATYKIRKRAEQRLAPYLLDGALAANMRDPVAADALTSLALHNGGDRSVDRRVRQDSGTEPDTPQQSRSVNSKGRMATSGSRTRSRQRLSKNGPIPGEQECGTTAPASPSPASPSPAVPSAPAGSSGVPSCA